MPGAAGQRAHFRFWTVVHAVRASGQAGALMPVEADLEAWPAPNAQAGRWEPLARRAG